jgi:hypothetical protein
LSPVRTLLFAVCPPGVPAPTPDARGHRPTTPADDP